MDLPEVSLVAILDADKEGFLRSETSLIQTIGRAARNAQGKVIMYADTITPSMRRAIDETERRRSIQQAFNEQHGIVPKTIYKSVRDVIEISRDAGTVALPADSLKKMTKKQREQTIQKLEFEYAAILRDQIKKLREGNDTAGSGRSRRKDNG